MIEQLTMNEEKYRETMNGERVPEMEKQLNELSAKYSQLKENYQNLFQEKLELNERLNEKNIQTRMVINEISESKSDSMKPTMRHTSMASQVGSSIISATIPNQGNPGKAF